MKCPSCFTTVPPRPAAYLCAGSCPEAGNDFASRARGYEVRTKPVTFAAPGTPGPLLCGRCKAPTAVEACPHCHYQIPDMWRSATVTCVAMAGARATGKSCLIAVAVRQLELLVERHHGSFIRPVQDTHQTFQSHYVDPLYGQGMAMQATSAVEAADSVSRLPLIFQYVERHGEQTRNRVLVIRDVAGEDLEGRTGSAAFSFFGRADAVITLVDPLTDPDVRGMLADLVPEHELGGDGLAVLHHVFSIMTNHVHGARTQVPIAVVLSKFDAVQKLRDVTGTEWSSVMSRPGSTLQRDPSLTTGHFDVDDGDLLHEEVSGLLDLLGEHSIRALLRESVDNYRFFAVSALGEFTQGRELDTSGIAPFRAVDPFKWALAQIPG